MVNLVIAAAITAGGLWYVFHYLNNYTMHGETITVPDFRGFKMNELDEFIKDKHLQYVITDSVYDGDKPKGVVLEQSPKPESQVKDGRKVYLTVNAINTPKVKLPEIKDLSIRQATAKIESYGLKVGDLISMPSSCVNCALGMEIKGKEVEAGTMVDQNTVVDVLLGIGESDEVIPVPFLLNLTYAQAKTWTRSLSINIGAVNFEDCATEEDSLNARIYKQLPESNDDNVINLGGSMDLWLTGDSIKLIQFLSDSLISNPDSTATH